MNLTDRQVVKRIKSLCERDGDDLRKGLYEKLFTRLPYTSTTEADLNQEELLYQNSLDIKQEAHLRMLAVIDEEDQRNSLAEMLSILIDLTMPLVPPESVTPAMATIVATNKICWTEIERLRDLNKAARAANTPKEDVVWNT